MDMQQAAVRGIDPAIDWRNVNFVKTTAGGYEWKADFESHGKISIFMQKNFTQGEFHFYCDNKACLEKSNFRIEFARCRRPSN